MNCDYEDIRSRIAEEPKWFDEHAVPRYCDFSPEEIASIYADECVLLLIECQACRKRFKVCISCDAMTLIRNGHQSVPLYPWLRPEELHYGDPPNVRCCPAGPTMSSNPLRVLEHWSRHDNRAWQRDPELEVEIEGGDDGREELG